MGLDEPPRMLRTSEASLETLHLCSTACRNEERSSSYATFLLRIHYWRIVGTSDRSAGSEWNLLLGKVRETRLLPFRCIHANFASNALAFTDLEALLGADT